MVVGGWWWWWWWWSSNDHSLIVHLAAGVPIPISYSRWRRLVLRSDALARALINDKHFDVISHCSLLLRYYIHICRLNKQPPNTNLLIKRIIYTSDLELIIATKKKKTDRQHQKWSPFFDLIESDI